MTRGLVWRTTSSKGYKMTWDRGWRIIGTRFKRVKENTFHIHFFIYHICSLKLSGIVVIHLTALEAHFMFARSQVALQMPIFLSFFHSGISYTRTFQFLCMSYDCYIMTLWPDTLFLHQVLWFSLLWAAVQNITSAVPGHYITGGLIYWFQSVNWVQFYAKIINEQGGVAGVIHNSGSGIENYRLYDFFTSLGDISSTIWY